MINKDHMGTKEILLKNGLKTLVDASDYEWLNQWKWYSAKGYAARSIRKGPKTSIIYMHRLIIRAEKGQITDHIDRNKLNNTKNNLRFCTTSQNVANVAIRTNKTGFKGVYKNGTKFMAMLIFRKKSIYCGRYSLAEEAAKSYDKKALELFGDFACLNFP